MLPVFIEAEYQDGYVHREDEQDHSPYVSGRNIFNDILEKRPVAAHGKMVRFSLILLEANQRHDVDWTVLPDNARPVRYKDMERDMRDGDWVGPARIVGIHFGYQYTDADGKNQQEIIEIR